jgi:cell division septation protein DedD
LPIENPADSAGAARYAVYFATANTRAAALPDEKATQLEALALSPVVEGSETWFRVTVGAHASRADAEALLARLRSQKAIGAGSIVSVPFALRLESNVTTAIAPVRLGALKARGIVAYALRQSSGNATIYTGAFESPAQATALADSLRATGVAPVLVYRTGRTF